MTNRGTLLSYCQGISPSAASSTIAVRLCVAIAASVAVGNAVAAFSCGGPLLDTDRAAFERMFVPEYGPALSHMGGPIASNNYAKKLEPSDFKRLVSPQPLVASSEKLTAAQAAHLKRTLNSRAQFQVPGWLSTVLGAVAPAAWVGLSADVTIQLLNGSGDAGRLALANVAGTVSEGGQITVFERVAADATGKPQFLWIYAYTAILNDKPTTAMLSACRADVVQLQK